jgi:hypothetical protein
MSVTTSVRGFVSPENDKYKKHAKVLIACIEAGVSELPKETAEYFGSKYPEKYLLEEKLEIKIPMQEYIGNAERRFEIYISEIPEGVHKIRFVNSW